MTPPRCPRCQGRMGRCREVRGHPVQRFWRCPACRYQLDCALVRRGAA